MREKECFCAGLLQRTIRQRRSQGPQPIGRVFNEPVRGSSMIICTSRKFIFVHINKTAGTSITEALAPSLQWNDIVLGATPIGQALDEPFKDRFNLYKHSTARDIRAVVGADVWSEFTTFAVVRDPVDRTVSFYRYLKRIETAASPLRQLRRRLLGRRPVWNGLLALRESKTFSDFIRHPILRYDPGFIPQHAFLSGENDEIIVDRLLRFEAIAEDFEVFCLDLGLGKLQIGHENRSGKGENRLSIPDSDIGFLKEYFAEDYALLARLPGRQKADDLRASSG
jgi:hypothetical protein